LGTENSILEVKSSVLTFLTTFNQIRCRLQIASTGQSSLGRRNFQAKMFNWRSKNAILEVKSSFLAAFLTTFKRNRRRLQIASTGQSSMGRRNFKAKGF
jgi:hypothetical protein